MLAVLRQEEQLLPTVEKNDKFSFNRKFAQGRANSQGTYVKIVKHMDLLPS